jgi:hypothetical protein
LNNRPLLSSSQHNLTTNTFSLCVVCVCVNSIMDPDLKVLRNKRWDRAFGTEERQGADGTKEAVNRKATIVIEHLIQASDVAHTMQVSAAAVFFWPFVEGWSLCRIRCNLTFFRCFVACKFSQHWHIYRRWNEKLFREMYKAYKEGRIDRDPATNWYSGK